jgi:hypothetical protein
MMPNSRWFSRDHYDVAWSANDCAGKEIHHHQVEALP